MSDKRRTFAVIDGNSLMHRAFHAVPPTMNAPDGRPTNAIFGFLNMFLKMIDAFNPDGVVVAFDKGKPRVRMEMLPQYKAQRPPMDPDLHAQFPMIKELLAALNVPILQSEGWEGDDILGTMARLGEEAEGLGLEWLLKNVEVLHAFPMHLWKRFETIDRFRAAYPALAARVVRITADGESFEV